MACPKVSVEVYKVIISEDHFEPCSVRISSGLFSHLHEICLFFLEMPVVLVYQLEIAFSSMPQIPEHQTLGK